MIDEVNKNREKINEEQWNSYDASWALKYEYGMKYKDDKYSIACMLCTRDSHYLKHL